MYYIVKYNGYSIEYMVVSSHINIYDLDNVDSACRIQDYYMILIAGHINKDMRQRLCPRALITSQQ